MENNNEIIIINNTEPIKVKKPKSEAQKEAQKKILQKNQNQILITWNAPEYQVKNIMIATKKKF